MEDKENEEYKKRINGYIKLVEEGKEKPEVYQQLFEELERLKEAIIPNIHDKYRNKNVIMGFIFLLQNCYDLIKDPNSPFEKEQFQENIDLAYKYIYEELKKQIFNPNRPKYAKITFEELSDINHKLYYMGRVLGAEKTEQFYKTYNIEELVTLFPPTPKKVLINSLIIFLLIVTIGIVILVIVFSRF